MVRTLEIPDLCLVLLVGTAGSGKSTFAAAQFDSTQVVSSDQIRALISGDAGDQSVNADAFDLLHALVAARLRHGRLTVVDATNVQHKSRDQLLRLAKATHVSAIAIVLDVPVDVCVARDAARAGRRVGERVVREHRRQLDAHLVQLREQRFGSVFHLRGVEEVNAAAVRIVRRECDRRDDRGPFDLIGDVHGCAAELRELLDRLGYSKEGHHPDGRRVIFLGDLVDRGPAIPETLEIAMNLVGARGGVAVMGNHDAKLLRWFEGKNVKVRHGLEQSVAQLERRSAAELQRYRLFLESLGGHYLLDAGRLVIAHGGLPQHLHGRTGGAVRAFCLFGDTTGETDEDGYPVRRDWGREYRGDAAVVYGHTPTFEPTWVNNTLCIDTGCVFGGSLTALRWPERDLVSVPAREIYCDHA